MRKITLVLSGCPSLTVTPPAPLLQSASDFVQATVLRCFQSGPMAKYTYVILHGVFGGVELLVVGAAARLMN